LAEKDLRAKSRGRASSEDMSVIKDMSKQTQELKNISFWKQKILGIDKEILDIGDMTTKTGKNLTKYGEANWKAKSKELDYYKQVGEEALSELNSLKSKYKSMVKSGKANVRYAYAFVRALLLNPVAMILAGLVAIGMALFKAVKDARDLQKELGGSVIQATKLSFALKAANLYGKLLQLDSDQIKDAFTSLVDKFGVINTRTAMFAVHLANTTRYLGTSTDQSAELLSIMMAVEGSSRQNSLNNLRSLVSLEEMKGVAPSVVFKALADKSELFANYTGDSQKNLVKAVIQAKKLNTEFGGLVDLGDSLLDVSERIQKEQLLSSMLGRQIDLERFMALGVQDDLVGQQREFARIFADFGSVNATTQRLIAEQLSMTVDEIAKWGALSYEQRAMGNKYGKRTSQGVGN